MSEHPANDREAYLDKHRRLPADDRLVPVVVELDGEVVGRFAEARGQEIEEVLFRLD